ncbi:P-loop ATPase, Sll1717 family [Streptomyces rubiginosohelvolus]|uniref:P-loop ATPase, Sll1717 family n=1 Tax=Streptomyces rubiginosohelvolus TaxID=67362 RepID=A0ABW6EYL5_9ACTN
MADGGSRRRSNFNIGGEQAEADPILMEAFYESDDYNTIASRDDSHCFLIARTGSGKSAVLQRLEEEHPDRVVRISPEDLSLNYITNLSVMTFLDDLEVSLDPLFIALWKHVLLVEMIRHRYKVDSPAAKNNFLVTLRDKIKRDPGKRAALDYLEEFQDKFWVEADERVREITEKFEEKINREAKGTIGFKGSAVTNVGATVGGGSADVSSTETRRELTERFQRIVNETQMARLNKMLKVLDEDILESRQNFTFVVIDDLDRDWVDEKLANSLVRCLFRAVLDLQRVRNLKVIVALRTNIFENLDFGHRSGGQEEKFRSLALHMRWSPSELRELVSDRMRVVSAKRGTPSSITDALPRTNTTRGDAFDYMLTRTLMRPRDIIAFLNETFSVMNGERASWEDIRTAEDSYSHKRLLALRDEWKMSYPDIDRVFAVFSGCRIPMSQEEFTRRIDDAVLLPADPYFRGSDWLDSMTSSMWSNPNGSWADFYGPLVTLLYNIGFIGCITGRHSTVRYVRTFPEYAERPSNLEATTGYMIHPTFQSALDVRIDGSRL